MCFDIRGNCYAAIFSIYALGALECGLRVYELIFIYKATGVLGCFIFAILICWVVVFIFNTILLVAVIRENSRLVQVYLWVGLVFGILLCIMQLVTYVNFPRSLFKEDKYLMEILMALLIPSYIALWVGFIIFPCYYFAEIYVE
ncbi:uncharacterized protein LOC119553172 [Drosophila subpulchrella]|uniref:uncharacterized protein LOC119553172 n=1 Tax=Drosophila subpulchrella TaxID=1486046 RepID=UPI0018A178E4|nr:uncharacterized protein LOC119553172 [Drosophila subpulchrella]